MRIDRISRAEILWVSADRSSKETSHTNTIVFDQVWLIMPWFGRQANDTIRDNSNSDIVENYLISINICGPGFPYTYSPAVPDNSIVTNIGT